MKKIIPLLFLCFTAHGTVLPQSPHVYVEGYAEEKIKPDTITISVLIEHNDLNAAVAKKTVDDKSITLLKAANKMGIERNDIKSTPLQIRPHIEYKNSERVESGTSVSRNIDITLRDLSRYHELNQALVDASISERIDAVVTLDNELEIKENVLFKALQNARAKAEQLAKINNKTIKDVYSISEFRTREENSYNLKPAQFIYGNSYDADIQTRNRVPPPPPGGVFEIGEMTASAIVYVVYTIE